MSDTWELGRAGTPAGGEGGAPAPGVWPCRGGITGTCASPQDRAPGPGQDVPPTGPQERGSKESPGRTETVTTPHPPKGFPGVLAAMPQLMAHLEVVVPDAFFNRLPLHRGGRSQGEMGRDAVAAAGPDGGCCCRSRRPIPRRRSGGGKGAPAGTPR